MKKKRGRKKDSKKKSRPGRRSKKRRDAKIDGKADGSQMLSEKSNDDQEASEGGSRQPSSYCKVNLTQSSDQVKTIELIIDLNVKKIEEETMVKLKLQKNNNEDESDESSDSSS